jgi:predicted TIM-barrel fold metal-dependent hydrolase
MTKVLVPFVLLASFGIPAAQPCPAEPIIDVHLHAYDRDPRFDARVPTPLTGKPNPATDGTGHRRLTLAGMKRLGIVRGIVSAESLPAAEAMVAADPQRLRLGFEVDALPSAQDLDTIRSLHQRGHLALIGEIAPQYEGIPPADPRLADFWKMAEELQVPVGYHMGKGPPEITQRGHPHHRASLGDPLLMEEVLVRHPKLKLFIMHGGFPFADNMKALMGAYPQVYLDLGAIHHAENRGAFHAYLKRMIEAGFAKRILFGSDQMVWPDAIQLSIDAYHEASYLTAEQRRDIFFNNAVRFFGWNDLCRP